MDNATTTYGCVQKPKRKINHSTTVKIANL